MPILTLIDADGDETETEVADNELLYHAISEAGENLPNSCGLGSQCGTCVIEVVKGAQNLSALDEEEVTTAEHEGIVLADPEKDEHPSGASRLACSCQMYDDVTVKLSEF